MTQRTTKKNSNPLKHVEFYDLVRVHVFRGQPSVENPCPFSVEFEALEQGKRVIFDDSSLKKMNEILTEKASQLNASDPRVRDYIGEFAGRLATELYRNGLAAIENVPDSPTDHYLSARNAHPVK